MPIQLSDVEVRILGSLVEKSLATPDQYPLSLKALTGACNQKTSRDPVMSLDEALIGKSLYPLIEKGLVEQIFELGTRVPKFKHHIDVLLGGQNPKEVGTVCVLLLRGPQTAGEIKGRTERLCEFSSTAEAEDTLRGLSLREDPFVVKLARQPGQKEGRYQHLFSGPVAGAEAASSPAPLSAPAVALRPSPAISAHPAEDRVARLEKRVEALEATLKAFEQRFSERTTS